MDSEEDRVAARQHLEVMKKNSNNFKSNSSAVTPKTNMRVNTTLSKSPLKQKVFSRQKDQVKTTYI